MKAITFLNTELEINDTNVVTAGHGHKKITVELCYQGAYKNFSKVTANMPDYDAAIELDGEEKDEALFNIVQYQLQDEIEEWIIEKNNSITYVICDSTCTSQAMYMDEDMNGCANIDDAKQYDSEDEAQAVIDRNNYNDWAYVVKND